MANSTSADASHRLGIHSNAPRSKHRKPASATVPARSPHLTTSRSRLRPSPAGEPTRRATPPGGLPPPHRPALAQLLDEHRDQRHPHEAASHATPRCAAGEGRRDRHWAPPIEDRKHVVFFCASMLAVSSCCSSMVYNVVCTLTSRSRRMYCSARSGTSPKRGRASLLRRRWRQRGRRAVRRRRDRRSARARPQLRSLARTSWPRQRVLAHDAEFHFLRQDLSWMTAAISSAPASARRSRSPRAAAGSRAAPPPPSRDRYRCARLAPARTVRLGGAAAVELLDERIQVAHHGVVMAAARSVSASSKPTSRMPSSVYSGRCAGAGSECPPRRCAGQHRAQREVIEHAHAHLAAADDGGVQRRQNGVAVPPGIGI